MESFASNGSAYLEEGIEKFLLVLTVSMSVATASRMFEWLRQIPYTLLLVIVGLVLALLDVRLVTMFPGLTLVVFLPPLLFEAAWNLQWREIRRDIVPISFYAIAGVVISIVGISFALHTFVGMSLPIALLVGASLSATDPVSVIALFKDIGAEKRLSTLMEGESLFNDGVAVVAFGSLLGLSLGITELTVPTAIAQFLVFTGIGIAIGLLIGFGISYLTQRFDLPLVEQSLTLLTAYGAYLITERLGGSGVIGVVTAGVVLGNYGSRVGMKPRTRQIVTEFWHFLAFFVNSIVFLLIGDQIHLDRLMSHAPSICVAIVAVLVTRAIAVFGLGYLSNLLVNSEIKWRDMIVLWWGGLRGSVSIALALSVPILIVGRDEVINIVFGIVLFTLLVQGLTTKALVEKLGLISGQFFRKKYTKALVQRIALNRILKFLHHERRELEIDADLYDQQLDIVRKQLNRVKGEINALQAKYPQLISPDVLNIEKLKLQEEMLAIEADAYAEFAQAGLIDEMPDSILQEACLAADFEQEEKTLRREQLKSAHSGNSANANQNGEQKGEKEQVEISP
jgi:CPA1 family monovalent cation:H+ antiporter